MKLIFEDEVGAPTDAMIVMCRHFPASSRARHRRRRVSPPPRGVSFLGRSSCSVRPQAVGDLDQGHGSPRDQSIMR